MEKYGEHAVQTVTDQGINTAAENSPAPPATTKSYLSPGVQANSPSQIPTIRKTMASDADTGSYVRKGSPREKHMQDLVHTDLSAILNTDSVDRRNRMLAEVGHHTTNIVYSSLLSPSAGRKADTARFVPRNERGTLLLDVLLLSFCSI